MDKYLKKTNNFSKVTNFVFMKMKEKQNSITICENLNPTNEMALNIMCTCNHWLTYEIKDPSKTI